MLFPIIGLALRPLSGTLLTPPLYLGLLFLCTLPSTVQASVAFTSIAGGNVAAALCSASASSIIGMCADAAAGRASLLKPQGGFSLNGAAVDRPASCCFRSSPGSCCSPGSGAGAATRKVVGWVDRGSVLLVVYGVFSAATLSGMWHQLAARTAARPLCRRRRAAAAMLAITAFAARRLGFSREDEIAIMFCGSKKSLVTGIPMANVLFAGQPRWA